MENDIYKEMQKRQETVDRYVECFSKNVVRYRNAKHISQKKFAERIPVCEATMNELERGRHYPSFVTAMMIACYIGGDIGDLFTKEMTFDGDD